jgi:hypothetical protein
MIFWEDMWNEPMSEEQHYRRGYCCNNKCKLCIFDPPHVVPKNTKVREEILKRLENEDISD